MNKVACVIVTFNRLEMLKKSIDHLMEQDYPCDILLIDNASTDGTGAWIAEFLGTGTLGTNSEKTDSTISKDPEAAENKEADAEKIAAKQAAFGETTVRYFNTGANLGGAGGFNYGMRKAYQLGYEYIWIMDDDAFVHKDTLSKLFEIDELLGGPENYGFLGSTVLWTDGTECQMNRHRIHRRYFEDFDKLQYGIIPVEASTFVSLLFPASTIKKAGLPIKEYFIWGDDVEYTMRITQKCELRSYMVGKSIITHAMKQNIGSDISVDSLNRIPNYKRAFRNENHTYRQYGFRGFMRYILRCGRYGMNVLQKSKDHRLLRCWVIISRFFSGFFFNPKIEYVDDPT